MFKITDSARKYIKGYLQNTLFFIQYLHIFLQTFSYSMFEYLKIIVTIYEKGTT